MPRSLITIVATIAMLPAMSLATVTLDIVGDLDPTAGFNLVSEIDGSAFGPGSQFTIWSVVNTERDLDGLSYKLHVNNDADNDKFDIVGYAVGPLSFVGPVFDGLGEAFDFAGPPLGWGSGDYTKKALPTGVGVPLETVINLTTTDLITASNIDGATVIGYIIQANNNFTQGVYEFSALGSIGTQNTAVWTASPENGPITEGASFILIPEPTSAMLLLAAVPFLRRRRS